MTKRIISFILVFAMIFTLFTVTVSAAGKEEYISEVALVYEDSIEDAKAAISGTDWKLFEQDLNPNADYIFDDGVYLIYKTSTNVEDAITDLRVMDMYGGFSISNYEKQLEASRANYLTMIGYLRAAASEFKTLYESGDAMAALAYRQMNYYSDVKTSGGIETGMKMGDFFLSMPDDNKVIQVVMEGNGIIVSNLVSLIAVGISGAGDETLATKIAEMYAVKDTLGDVEYYKDAEALASAFKTIKAKLLRYDTLAEEYDLEDDEMSEEEYIFLTEYAAIADLLTTIAFGETTLAEFIRGEWEIKDLYPIVAAFTSGQKALIEMGQLETVLKYSSPSKPIAELIAAVEEVEETIKDENGNLKVFDVYMGVDRSIFKGSFAMTSEAERQQALTGETWGIDDAASRSVGMTVGYIVSGVVDLAMAGTVVGLAIKKAVLNSTITRCSYLLTKLTNGNAVAGVVADKIAAEKALSAFTAKWAGVQSVLTPVAIGFALVLIGGYGIATWYNYYNPDYTEIPNTMIDVRETDLGDKYIKYTAAKVLEDGELSEKNADFNAYEGKEWNALYYTKDATAGNCLTPKFVYSETSSTVARRHQGISMFGETEAFNLNSHVYSKNAPGVYVTIRYSTAKKAAADVPNVVGSMFATGALYALTTLCGAALGVGGTLLAQKAMKKKDEPEAESSEEN